MGALASCLLQQASVQGMVSQLNLMPATELQIFTRTLSSGQVDHHMTLCGGGRGINVHVHSFPTFFASLGRLICHCLKLTVRLVIQFHHGSNCYCFLFVTVLVFDADVHSISLGLIVAACFLLLRWCLMLMLAVFPWD